MLQKRDELRPGGPHWPVYRLYLLIVLVRVNNGTREFTGIYRGMQDVQEYKVKVGTLTRVYRGMQEYTVVYKGLQRINMVYIRVYLGEYKSLHWYTRV